MPSFNISQNDSSNGFSNKIDVLFKFDYTVTIDINNTEYKLFVQKIDRPSVKVNVEEIWGLNDVQYNPGRRSYDPLTMTVVEYKSGNNSTFAEIYKAFKSYYGGHVGTARIKESKLINEVKNIIIRVEHNCGNSIIYLNCFIVSIKPDELTYESNDILKYTITFRYDDFIID